MQLGLLARRSAPFVITLVLCTVFAPSVTALSKTPLNTNLVKNPGAEADSGGNGYTGGSPSMWSTNLLPGSNWKVVKYGSPDFPTKAEASRIGGGSNFFSCGPAVRSAYLSQEIHILGRNPQIDGELLKFKFSVRIATYDSQQDYGGADVYFLDAARNVKGGQSTGDYISATNGRFLKRSFSEVVPAGTRYVLVRLYGNRVGGAEDYCDAYFDKVSFVINKL